MKTIFPRNTKKNKRKKILTGVFAAFILVILIFHDFSFRILSRPVLYIVSPFLKIQKSIGDWKEKIISGFADKDFLARENKFLRGKVEELEIKISLPENIKMEIEKLKQEKYISASIIYRPPFTPFDILIVDSGTKDGVREGAPVSAFGDVLLGYAADVFSDTAKIKLISSFKQETNVVLSLSRTPAIAIGRGSENMEITLPKAVKTEVGEKIMTFGREPLLVGFVEKIESWPEDPFQKIIFRIPVNIQQLEKILILK